MCVCVCVCVCVYSCHGSVLTPCGHCGAIFLEPDLIKDVEAGG